MNVPRGQNIIVWTGDTLNVSIARDLGDISTRTALWFVVKSDHVDEDDEAKLFVDEATGLRYINGEVATTPANGSITVTDAARGRLTVTVAAVEMAKLVSRSGLWYYEIKVEQPSTITTLLSGQMRSIRDVQRATS